MNLTLPNLIHFILLFLIFVFLILIFILITNRLRYESYKARKKSSKTKIDIFLTSILFSDLNEDEIKSEINQFKKTIPFKEKWCKKIILNEIINLNENLKGEITKNIHLIYEEFDLFIYSLMFLNNRKWYVKSLGIYQFQTLEYIKAERYIKPYLNHKNKRLVLNAYFGLISLASDNLELLGEYPNSISMKSEIKIMDILYSKKPPMPTNLKDWIDSKNPSVVKLGIKFMVFYNYLKETQPILNLLQSEDKTIRHEVIVAVNDLLIIGAEQVLIDQFDKEEKTNKIEILKSLSAIGTQKTEKFISDLLINSIDKDLKLEGVYTLNKINPNYLENAFAENLEIRKMANHVKDPYI